MPKRPSNFQKSRKRTATLNISSSSSSSSEEDTPPLEEPVLESNTGMAKRLRGTVTPPTSTTPIAGPSRQFAAGIHPTQITRDPRTRSEMPEVQIVCEIHPEINAGPSGIPRIVPAQIEISESDSSTTDSSDSDRVCGEGETVPFEEYAPYCANFDSDGEIINEPDSLPKVPKSKSQNKRDRQDQK